MSNLIERLHKLYAIHGYESVKEAIDALEAMQKENELLRADVAFLRPAAQRADNIEKHRDELFARVAELEEELDNERAKGVHSCHANCKRPLCVANRRIAELESEAKEQAISMGQLCLRIAELEAALRENGEAFAAYGDHVRQAGCYAIADGENHND